MARFSISLCLILSSAIQVFGALYSPEIRTLNYTTGDDSSIVRRDASSTPPGYRNVVYFGNWDIYDRDFQISQLYASDLTHVIYAFADISLVNGSVQLSDPYADLQKHFEGDSWTVPTGANYVYGNIKQLYLLKKQNRNLKTLLSIGGWTYRYKFAPVMEDPALQTQFVTSAVQMVKDLGFDGLDIDWEYPNNTMDATDYVTLLKDLRAQLDDYSESLADKPHFLLSVASPAAPDNIHNEDFLEMDQYVDFWNMMAYDYAGPGFPGPTITGYLANLYASNNNATTPFNTDQAVQLYKAAGIALSKVLMGIPLYGRSFANTGGMGQSYSGAAPGEYGEAGVYNYNHLPHPGAKEFFDPKVVGVYCYLDSNKTLTSYDNPASMAAKLNYIQQNGMGGTMFWDASMDYPLNSDKSLQQLSFQAFQNTSQGIQQVQNNLYYNQSQYANMAAGMP